MGWSGALAGAIVMKHANLFVDEAELEIRSGAGGNGKVFTESLAILSSTLTVIVLALRAFN